MNRKAAGASFRDQCGYVFLENGKVFRQINIEGKEDFILLIRSGLYDRLTNSNILVRHTESSQGPTDEQCWKIIEPEKIPFISYPWEWCFEEFRTAALTTLKICRIALEHGMVLKDASAFNIQFNGVDPIFIDTLSFTSYSEGSPWTAYGQFCRHFLAPLVLGAKKDIRTVQFFSRYLDGIPLDLAVRLLPRRAIMNIGLLLHLYIHAFFQTKTARYSIPHAKSTRRFSRNAMSGLIDSLETAIRRLRMKRVKSSWSDYPEKMNYSDVAFEGKRRIVEKMLASLRPSVVWDFGANEGVFSAIAARYAYRVISFDLDHEVVDRSFIHYVQNGVKNVLPLVMDLTNPTPSCGWAHEERMSLAQRGPADCLMALAFIHHLAIVNNVAFEKIAQYFAAIAQNLIIEFVPKNDEQIVRMLSTREDIFGNYTEKHFECAMETFFSIEEKVPIDGCKRILYRLKNKTYKSDDRFTSRNDEY